MALRAAVLAAAQQDQPRQLLAQRLTAALLAALLALSVSCGAAANHTAAAPAPGVVIPTVHADKTALDNGGTIKVSGRAAPGKPVFLEVWSVKKGRVSFFDARKDEKIGVAPYKLYKTSDINVMYRIYLPKDRQALIDKFKADGPGWSYSKALKETGADVAYKVPARIGIDAYQTSLMASMYGSTGELLLILAVTTFGVLMGAGGGFILNPLLLTFWLLPHTVVAGTAMPIVLFSQASGVFMIAVLATMFGFGGGPFMVPLLTVALGLPMYLVVGSSLLAIFFNTLMGSARHYQFGHVDIDLLLVMFPAAVIAGFIAPQIAKRINPLWVKRIAVIGMLLLAFSLLGLY